MHTTTAEKENSHTFSDRGEKSVLHWKKIMHSNAYTRPSDKFPSARKD